MQQTAREEYSALSYYFHLTALLKSSAVAFNSGD